MEILEPDKCPRVDSKCEHCDGLVRESVVQILGYNVTAEMITNHALTVAHEQLRVAYVDDRSMPEVGCAWRQEAVIRAGQKIAKRYQMEHSNEIARHFEDQ